MTALFEFPITASYNGFAPPDATGTPDYKLKIEVSSVSIFSGRHPSSTGITSLQWEETTPGHGATSTAVPLITTDDFNDITSYVPVDWDPNDYDVSLTTLNDPLVRTFDLPLSTAGDLRYLDGLEVEGRVVLTYNAVPTPGTYRWLTTGLGDWNTASNWDTSLVPNANSKTVIFGSDVVSATTVVTNSAVVVKNAQFDSLDSYAIAGLGSVTLLADAGNSSIDVTMGSHQFQAVVGLGSAVDVDVAGGASLAFNNALNTNGFDLTKTGTGTMEINSALNVGGGTVNVLAGSLSGSGLVSGDLNNNGGTVAPGNSPGTLSVAGNYLQSATSTLAIEIAGLLDGEYDVLDIAGFATIEGDLDISLLSFTPSLNDSFTVLTADLSITDNGLNLTGDLANLFSLSLGNLNTELILTFLGLPGDFDFDGDVDGFDFLLWQQGGSPDPLSQTDLADWEANYGQTSPLTSAVASVPEPNAAILFLTMFGALALSRSRKAARLPYSRV